MATSLSEALGAAGGAAIRQWVRLTGRRVRQRDAPWLDCPMGPPGRIGPEFYGRLAERERLHIRTAPDAGLLPDFAALKGGRFDPAAVRPEVRDFYEHTSRYALEAWSEAPVPTRLFLWALTQFVSRRMDQLNFPVSSLELAGGMTSDILERQDRPAFREGLLLPVEEPVHQGPGAREPLQLLPDVVTARRHGRRERAVPHPLGKHGLGQ